MWQHDLYLPTDVCVRGVLQYWGDGLWWTLLPCWQHLPLGEQVEGSCCWASSKARWGLRQRALLHAQQVQHLSVPQLQCAVQHSNRPCLCVLVVVLSSVQNQFCAPIGSSLCGSGQICNAPQTCAGGLLCCDAGASFCGGACCPGKAAAHHHTVCEHQPGAALVPCTASPCPQLLTCCVFHPSCFGRAGTNQCQQNQCLAPGQVMCGATVCGVGQTCQGGTVCCDSTATFCNNACCPNGNACVNNQCVPQGSVPCGTTVCQPNMICGNPSTGEEEGGVCCAKRWPRVRSNS